MILRIITLIVISSIFFSCDNSTKEKDNTYIKPTVADVSNTPIKISDIEPNLWKADSLQVLYYDNPDGDSLRYSRFFSYANIIDSGKVNAFLRELNQSFIKQESKRNCRSEGKLFLLNKEEILKTIYFSTRGDSCSYMYLIKDGLFVYFSLSDNAKKFLEENKHVAKKP
jgi:hypothetical protein